MLKNPKLLHTPDGVRDIIGEECAGKLRLEQNMRGVLHSFGYQDIETPTFEYFDVFGTDIGTIPSRELYKFFDRDGNTLVLRPDFTPSIARTAARYFISQQRPVRLCYLGNTFVNTENLRGSLRENTQLGAELIGDDSISADAEVIAMAVRTLICAGLKEFQISIGHVGYFAALAQQAGLDEETEEELKTLIRNRNLFGAEKLMQSQPIDESLKQAFAALPSLFGQSLEVLDRAEYLAAGTGAAEAVTRLRKVYELLGIYGVQQYISFDLGMMGTYMYYTGIIFRGYTYGTGDALVKGGRYDRLLESFGKRAPSIGYALIIGQIMNALSRQKIEFPEGPGKRLSHIRVRISRRVSLRH